MYQNPPPAREKVSGLGVSRVEKTWLGANRGLGSASGTLGPLASRGRFCVPLSCCGEGGETNSWQLRAKTNKVKELRKVELTQPAYADGVMEGWEG